MNQLYGMHPQYNHIQHKSVISNFQGSNGCSPQNIHTRLQLPNQPVGNVEADPNNGSFENYFDTGSNNEEPYMLNEGGGLMINMQDLKNVRESYSKNLDKLGLTNGHDDDDGD